MKEGGRISTPHFTHLLQISVPFHFPPWDLLYPHLGICCIPWGGHEAGKLPPARTSMRGKFHSIKGHRQLLSNFLSTDDGKWDKSCLGLRTKQCSPMETRAQPHYPPARMTRSTAFIRLLPFACCHPTFQKKHTPRVCHNK